MTQTSATSQSPFSPSLPIDAVLDDIRSTLQAHSALVLCAPPGSGKTTRVPLALLPELSTWKGNLLMLEPRRIAARATAGFMAKSLGEAIGETVGYQVRFDKKQGPNTQIHVVTEGILTRRFLSDPFLEGISCVIIDEFHERSVNVDLALCLLKETLSVRDDLKVIVMSATINSDEISRYLNDAPVLNVSAAPYPLTTHFHDSRLSMPTASQRTEEVTRAVKRALAAHAAGDLLVFLPGAHEIESTRRALQSQVPSSIEIVPLYGALPPQVQDAALQPGTGRRIVLATNIAETSLTIPNISIVVDSGLEKRIEWRSGIGFEKLVTGTISRFSATQRAGRAARTGPGSVYRLWSQTQHNERPQQSMPEIQRVDPMATVFTLIAAFSRSPQQIDLLTPLGNDTVERALETLRTLKLLHPNEIQFTPLAKELTALPLHPRLGLVVAAAHAQGRSSDGALAAAILAERNVLARGHEEGSAEECDVRLRMRLLKRFEQNGKTPQAAYELGLHPGAARNVIQLKEQIERIIRPRSFTISFAGQNFLLPGFLDRVCKKNASQESIATLATGRGVVLDRNCQVRQAPFFIALDGDAAAKKNDTRSWVSMASAIGIDELMQYAPERFRHNTNVQYDDRLQKVTAQKVTTYFSLEMESVPLPHVPEEKRADLFLVEIMRQWKKRLLDTPKKQNAFARLSFAAAQQPELGLPPFTEEAITAILAPFCQTATRLSELFTINLPAEIEGQLPYANRLQLRTLAPDSFLLPSGRQLPIDYTQWMDHGASPMIRVKLQELFGLMETPRLGPKSGTRSIPLAIALLAPNGREVQITTDLQSFWRNTYPEVRKELRARYAKHFWPENPNEATATHLTKKQFLHRMK